MPLKGSLPKLIDPFIFDIVTQLANILAYITLHELLQLSSDTREALQEALVDSKSFLTQFRASIQVPNITFTPKDTLLKDAYHDCLLYDTKYIRSFQVQRMQIDTGLVLSIMPRQLMSNLVMPLNQLSPTTTTVFEFNNSSSHPLGKLQIKYPIGDLATPITCYIMNIEPYYSLLLGQPCIHKDLIVPSTLQQCFNDVDEEDTV